MAEDKSSNISKLTIEQDQLLPRKVLTGINDRQHVLCDFPSADIKEPSIHVNELPSVILINIFRYLTTYDLLCRTSLVCKHWYQLSRDADLWRVIDIHGQGKVTDEILERLVSLSDRVLELDIRYLDRISNKGFHDALARCPHLRLLKMDSCSAITNDGFNAIGELCHQLRRLHLDHCYTLQDTALQAIGRGCPELIFAHLHPGNMVTDVGISALMGCHKIQTLVIVDYYSLTDNCLASLVDNWPELNVLGLPGCHHEMTDNGVCHLAKLRNLENLDISFMYVSEAGVIPILKSCHKLHTLSLSNVSKIGDSCMEHIADNLPLLKHLNVTFCPLTDTGLCSLAKYSKQLESIDLSCCRDITDHGIIILSAGCPNMRSMKLTVCNKLTDKCIPSLVDNCPGLEFLSLSCTLITDVGAAQLAKLCKIENLDLSNTHASEVSVISIVKSCHKLHTLDLSGLDKIGDSCIEHVAQNLPLLKHLRVHRGSLTDAALHTLVKYSPQLEVIDLEGCREITEHGISIISAGCPNLHDVDLQYCGKPRPDIMCSPDDIDSYLEHCGNVSADAIDQLSLIYPRIHYRNYRTLTEISHE